MAKTLAALARRIRSRATELIAAQTASGSLVKLHKAFKEALIHDLTPKASPTPMRRRSPMACSRRQSAAPRVR